MPHPNSGSAGRFTVFGPENIMYPQLDAIGPERRIDPNAPMLAAWLGGRPVVLARPDPLTRRPGEPGWAVTRQPVARSAEAHSGRAIEECGCRVGRLQEHGRSRGAACCAL